MIDKKLLGMALAAILFASCKQMPKQTETTEKAQEEVAESINRIDDFSMNTPEGTTISALDEISKHKLTIIDFWASWCGPCLYEMPRVAELYNKYKDKGLGIISISLDTDETSWKNAIKELNMSWTNVSELNGWENTVARAFNVYAIPHTVIVAQDGVILQNGLIGNDLINYIEKQFSK